MNRVDKGSCWLKFFWILVIKLIVKREWFFNLKKLFLIFIGWMFRIFDYICVSCCFMRLCGVIKLLFWLKLEILGVGRVWWLIFLLGVKGSFDNIIKVEGIIYFVNFFFRYCFNWGIIFWVFLVLGIIYVIKSLLLGWFFFDNIIVFLIIGCWLRVVLIFLIFMWKFLILIWLLMWFKNLMFLLDR